MAGILYADPELSNLDLMEGLLIEKGHTVHTCSSGSDLLREAQSKPVDLVVMDSELLKANNVSLCKVIKKRKDRPISIIVIGDADDEESIVASLSDGADDYILKPLKITEMLAKISILLATNQVKLEKKQREPESFAGIYEIQKEIGSGSYSKVFHAIDTSKAEKKQVALKVFDLDSYQLVESSMQSFLLREAYAMSKLDHPNIVKMYDFGKSGDKYYMVMEMIPGASLEHVVKNTGPLSEDQLIFIAFQASSVLKYLHENSILHRDIKPANILVNDEGDIKFTDFGLSKHRNDHALTQKCDNFMGTPQYVAPEQIVPDENDEADIRCDVYSLGATMYFAGTGRPPFSGKTPIDVLNSNMNDHPTPMYQVNPEISKSFSDLVVVMMQKKKKHRFSPSALRKQLKILLKQDR